MIKYLLSFTILVTLLNSCQVSNNIPKEYPRMIGDISYDAAIDTADFNLCNDGNWAVQYYAFTSKTGEKPYLQEKYELQNIFDKNYNPTIAKKESGLLRIRFIVNCEGESGRFRMIGMDENYKEKEFDPSITNQLLLITKDQIKWKSFKTSSLSRDYYMYLIFKIENGKIIEILP